ncbi:MAG: hypothetical protein CVU56_24165 [Deltaproteobacteria bacterium HGW-Deltaproteobacteria-14]|jgi:hypothetical protein|nr:MAG: hypothetical protein CVU56_24165 [Deltaproteobacteria bacterium HGW-Deltaproteobacteria-14]
MSHRLAALLVTSALLTTAGVDARAESPRNATLALHFGTYVPQVDAQFEAATPWADVFGASTMLLIGIEAGYELWKEHGVLELAGGWRYGWVDGKALNSAGEASNDSVGFNFMPFTASAIYRWDWAAVRHGIPLVPYVKIGLTAALWWGTNGKDEISNTRSLDGSAREGRGLTLGWHAGGGIQFLLDAISPGMAADFDTEAGVNNSYLFAELLYTDLSDFGSASSIDLGDTAFSFGLMFEL